MAYLEAHSDCVRGHDENLLREIYYSHVGGFDQRWAAAEAGHWLDELRPNRALLWRCLMLMRTWRTFKIISFRNSYLLAIGRLALVAHVLIRDATR